MGHRKSVKARRPQNNGNCIGDVCPELINVCAEEREKQRQMEEMWRQLERFTDGVGHRRFDAPGKKHKLVKAKDLKE
jgi:ribosomal protein L44E